MYIALTPLPFPLSLSPALWLDPSDLSTLFQDSAGTTPVTADGHPVGKILDKSGNGYHASQSTASKRPLYRTSGGLSWLEFDGVDDSLSLSGSGLNILRNSPAATGIAAVKDNTPGSLRVFLQVTRQADSNTRYQMRTSASSAYEMQTRWDDVTSTVVSGGTVTGSSQVVTMSADFATGGSGSHKIRVNGTQVASGAQVGGAGNTPDTASQRVSVGSFVEIANWYSGRIFQLILFRSVLNAANLALAESYVAGKAGVSL
jgi:hypothetical protein